MSVMDNTAIERIAAPDLAEDALELLHTYGDNDDVVFFLGRLVWQGEMSACLPALMDIACDAGRGRYARIASIRGVMSLADTETKDRLWATITDQSGPLDQALLVEILKWAPATAHSVELLLRTLRRLAPFDRLNSDGIEGALHDFVDRLTLMVDQAEDQPLVRLVEGLSALLGEPPFVERGECHVSKAFAWLMAPALHAVDRLVAARSVQALSDAAIAIMRNMPALRFWRSDDLGDYKTSLGANVPRWPELNDRLYWTSIAEFRAHLSENAPPLVDDWQITFGGHFWGFGREDFERCLGWVRTKENGDDRAVALSRCIQIYFEAGQPAAWLLPLREAVQGDSGLEALLEARLDPKPSPAMQKIEAERRVWEAERKDREREEQALRADWVAALKEDPDRVRHPAGLTPGEFSNDQLHLLVAAMKDAGATNRQGGANWRNLIPEFGEPVARAYRDAALAHWRAYLPGLQSEGAAAGSTPYSLIFGMMGLSIEAAEDSAFAERLTADEARRAFRYVTWELNGFPGWFEPLYRAHSAIGLEAVRKELIWELDRTVADQPCFYILHDILYHAPWLHAAVAPLILEWLGEHEIPNADGLRFCLNILTGGGVPPPILAELAREKVRDPGAAGQAPRWFALWVDTDPSAAIPALDTQLQSLPAELASAFAQHFATGLLGDRHGAGARVGAYRNAQDLKTLYVLMHRYIRAADDIERAGKGVYSPTLRDNAQEARNTLFNILVSLPGAEAYAAIKALEQEHPEPDHRRWMARRARERATIDADEPLWTVEQAAAFAQSIASG